MADKTRREFLQKTALLSTAAAINPMSIAQAAELNDFVFHLS